MSVAAAGVLVVFGAGGASAAKRVSSGGEALSSEASAASSAIVGWGRGVEAVLPADAAANPNIRIESVSCPSAGNCSAVGEYADSSGGSEGLLLTESSGRWGSGVEAVLPANAAPMNQFVGIDSVSCASAGNCSAVGEYKPTDNSGISEGLLLTETAGSWGTGVEAVLPAGAPSPIEGASLVSVSCASAGNCSAVANSFGQFTSSFQGLLFAETAGVWGAGVEAPLPANANPQGGASLSSVSCSSARNCSAVGGYTASPYIGQGLLLTQTAGKWTAVEAALPANAGGGAGASLGSVSCASAGNCSAVGSYTSSSGGGGLLLTETAGSWGTGVTVVLPANACPVGPGAGECDSAGGGGDAVSCASAGNCSAVGGYTDNTGADVGLLLAERAGRWRAGVEAPRHAAPPGAVACVSAGNCSAVGYGGVLLTETAGKWTAAKAALPANAGAQPGADLTSVSCATAGRCSAVGDWRDSSGNYHGLLLDSHRLPPCVVPKLTGKALAAARRAIRSHACSLGRIKQAASQRITKGHVISQEPEPGRRLQHGARVNLVVSKGRR